jgi:HSP20 family molecular chaperone IbpA
MTTSTQKEMTVQEKKEVAVPAEPTRSGVLFIPNVDIFETDKQITLVADLPGVTTENLTIDLRDNILTLSGEVQPFEGANEKDLLIEYEVGKYYRQFTLSDVIAQSQIDAQLKDGVLRLTLPKVEKAKPRTISVSAG